jgi:hypothetical protein
MKTSWGKHAGLALSTTMLSLVLAGPSFAAAHVDGQKMWLACENGRNYPIEPIAVSRFSDLVTGYLLRTGTGHAVHLRLVPMGNGYRYEGPGMWFDGVRGDAVLDWGTPYAVPCTVMQE